MTEELPGSLGKGEVGNQKGCLLAHLPVLVLQQVGANLEQIVIDHLISDFLVLSHFIERLKGVSAVFLAEIDLQQSIHELRQHSVEVSNCNL